MKKPKIICTLGTTTDDSEVLKGMIAAGMSCARINTAYATTEDYKKRLELLRSVADIDVMMDIKGPQVRLIAEHPYKICEGDIVKIGFKEGPIRFTKDFYYDIEPDDELLIENGTIRTTVETATPSGLSLMVTDPGEGYIRKQMGVNVPGKYLHVQRFNGKDMQAIDFAAQNNVGYIALSFVRTYQDISSCKKLIDYYQRKHNSAKDIGIVAKIEDSYGINNLEKIISSSMADKIRLSVMVARGDLYVELPQAELPLAQELIIRTCRKHGIFVITATGILESMQYHSEPTRAEVCDVYQAIGQGTDALMLSGETSNGCDPVRAVQVLAELIERYTQ